MTWTPEQTDAAIDGIDAMEEEAAEGEEEEATSPPPVTSRLPLRQWAGQPSGRIFFIASGAHYGRVVSTFAVAPGLEPETCLRCGEAAAAGYVVGRHAAGEYFCAGCVEIVEGVA